MMENGKQPISKCVLGAEQLECTGLTKREYFAGLAMQALITNAPDQQLHNTQEGVGLALVWADELLKQLES